jgi:heme/copper-type cytochrome/quinol oxidase subunit 2
MFKKIYLFFFFISSFVSQSAFAQCAMCKKVAQDAGGINDGIIYIMLFPYIILLVFGVLIYYRYKKNKEQKSK